MDESGRIIRMSQKQWDGLSEEERSVYIEEQAAMAAEAFWGARGDELPTITNKIWQRFWDRIRMGLVKIGWATEQMKLEDIFVRAGTGKLGGSGIDMNVEVRNKYLGSKVNVDPVQFIDKQLQGGSGRYNQGYVEVDDTDGRSIRIPVGESWTVIENGKPVEKGYGLVHAQKHQDVDGKSIVRALKEGSREVRKNQTNYILKLNDNDTIKVGTSRGWDGDDNVNVMLTAFIYERDGRIKTKALTQSAEEMPDKPRPPSTRPAETESLVKNNRQVDSDKTRNKLIPTQKQVKETMDMMYARGRNLLEQKLPNRFSQTTLRNLIAKDMKDEEVLAFHLEEFLAKAPDIISKDKLNEWMDKHEIKLSIKMLADNRQAWKPQYKQHSSRYGQDYREYLFHSQEADGYSAPHFGGDKRNLVMHMRVSDFVKVKQETNVSIFQTYKGKRYNWHDEIDLARLALTIAATIDERRIEGWNEWEDEVITNMLLTYKRNLQDIDDKRKAALNAYKDELQKYKNDVAKLIPNILEKTISVQKYRGFLKDCYTQLRTIELHETPSGETATQRPGLIIEELQSDFHQAARKRGYLDSAKEAEIKAILKELDRIQRRLLSEYGYKDMSSFLEAGMNMEKKTKELERQMAELIRRDMLKRGLLEVNSEDMADWRKRAEAISQERTKIMELRTEIMNIENQKRAHTADREALPNIPFKKFHEFLFKYALLESAQKGYGDIYWTTGEMQADRYGRDQERESGMKGFYDKIVADFANKLAKRYGVKADVVTMNAPEAWRGSAEFNHLTITPEMRQDLLTQGLPRYKMAPSQDEIAEAEAQMEAVRKQYQGTDQWMKAPNGKPSNLNERQWLQVRTPNFLNWFGDWINDPKNASKVVDENGEPMVVYHGTATAFNVFKATKDNNTAGYEAYFFTSSTYVAERYAATSEASKYFSTNSGTTIYPLFLNIRDPRIKDAKGRGGNGQDAASIRGAVKSAKYHDNDGTVIRNVIDDVDYEIDYEQSNSEGPAYKYNYDRFIQDEYIVFSQEQIKSAIGNVGTFNPEDADIRYKLLPDEVNQKFNNDLVEFDPSKHRNRRFSLGKPGEILSKSGIEEKEIFILGRTIQDKSGTIKHPFDPQDLQDLPERINDPIFVMDSVSPNQDDAAQAKTILTEIRTSNGNILAVLKIKERGRSIQINQIVSIYPKHDSGVARWIREEQRSFRYINKEKALAYLSDIYEGSDSPRWLKLTKDIDKIDEAVGLSSPNFRVGIPPFFIPA